MPYLSAPQRAAALAVLELPEHVTGEQVTRAYRRLAKRTHPDATGRSGPEAGRRFAAVSEAYRQLMSDTAAPSATPAGRRVPAPRPVRLDSRATCPPIVAGPVIVTTPGRFVAVRPGSRP